MRATPIAVCNDKTFIFLSYIMKAFVWFLHFRKDDNKIKLKTIEFSKYSARVWSRISKLGSQWYDRAMFSEAMPRYTLVWCVAYAGY